MLETPLALLIFSAFVVLFNSVGYMYMYRITEEMYRVGQIK